MSGHNTTLNRSGLSRISTPTNEVWVQTEIVSVDKPKIRVNRNCADAIKSACAQVLSACGASTETACIAVKTNVKHCLVMNFI